MNQRMRRQDLSQLRQRPSGSEHQSTSRQPGALRLQTVLQISDCTIGQPSRRCLNLRNESAPFVRRHSLRRVVRLPKFVNKGLDQVNFLPREHTRHPLRRGERHQRGPAGVCPKPKCSSFHVAKETQEEDQRQALLNCIDRIRISSATNAACSYSPTAMPSGSDLSKHRDAPATAELISIRN